MKWKGDKKWLSWHWVPVVRYNIVSKSKRRQYFVELQGKRAQRRNNILSFFFALFKMYIYLFVCRSQTRYLATRTRIPSSSCFTHSSIAGSSTSGKRDFLHISSFIRLDPSDAFMLKVRNLSIGNAFLSLFFDVVDKALQNETFCSKKIRNFFLVLLFILLCPPLRLWRLYVLCSNFFFACICAKNEKCLKNGIVFLRLWTSIMNIIEK